jgi:hypothetical protein
MHLGCSLRSRRFRPRMYERTMRTAPAWLPKISPLLANLRQLYRIFSAS